MEQRYFSFLFTYIIVGVVCMIFPLSAICQNHIKVEKRPQGVPCQLSLKESERKDYKKSIQGEKEFSLQRMDGIWNLPVQFHIVRRTNGTGGITAADATAELDAANIRFATLDVEFFQCSPARFIDDDFYFNTEFDYEWEDYCGQTTAEYLIAGQNNVSNVINIYYVNTDGWNWSSLPASLADCKDWIIMNHADTGSATLLAHELGHYFNLLHTFQGYGDGVPDNHEYIPRNSEHECFNCEEYGDLLCDTNADNNSWDAACNWDGEGGDGCSGLDFDPEEDNIMSYSDCPSIFTQGQMNRMIACILTSRAYLDCPFLSNCQSTWNLSGSQNGMYAYQASNSITSTADINPGAVSVYDAANSIRLTPGFHAKAGTVFNAFLDGCWGPVIYK